MRHKGWRRRQTRESRESRTRGVSIFLLPLLQACPDANVYVRGVVEMHASAVSSAVVNVVGYGKRR